ncbi:hypothetical protein BDP27DRAFT_1445695 [Rhodocollybia butyracea]|uniref:Uncharacterized protein n=1 Tax=Rhodocollybia butyracea TaxID=206335 RepID=A0A9P5PU64_9AGAR|nr:hypothetical protein BDP27DRAFT_1445695 [Rhodocollybia butyracea]
MRAGLLLFTLIASILAVSPTPVPARPPHPNPTMTFIGPAGLKLGTDENDETRFPNEPTQSALNTMFGDVFGFKCKINYRGLYEPQRPKDRQWLYLANLTGVDTRCTVEHPCFGWRARSYRIQNRKGKAIMGKPEAKPIQTAVTKKMQEEWDILLKEFMDHFMIDDKLPPLPTNQGPTRQRLPKRPSGNRKPPRQRHPIPQRPLIPIPHSPHRPQGLPVPGSTPDFTNLLAPYQHKLHPTHQRPSIPPVPPVLPSPPSPQSPPGFTTDFSDLLAPYQRFEYADPHTMIGQPF